MPVVTDARLSVFDELLHVLEDAPASQQASSAAEHAEGARVYLLGAMPEEYELNLKMLRESVNEIPDAATRDRAVDLVNQIDLCR
jgi:hypothetical protein